MALPTFVAKGTFASGIGDVTPGLPAGIAANDLLLLAVESAKQAAAAPSGWTECPSSPQENSGGSAGGSNAVRITAFYRIATGSDTDPTVADTGDHTTALIVAYRGVNTSSPFNTSAGAGYAASTTITAPGVTTTVADCMIVHLIGSDRDSNSTTSMSGWTNAALANVTERHEQTVNAGFGGGIFVVDGEKATSGVVGDTTGTYTVSEEHASITLAVQPPSGSSLPTGISSESDSALGLAKRKTKPAGLASTADASLSVTRVKAKVAGLASEADSAPALSRAKQRASGLASETDLAFALARIKTKPVGLAVESDTALTLARIKQRAAGASAEADTAFSLARIKSRATGLSIETDTGLALAGGGEVPSVVQRDPGTRGGHALRKRLIREYEDEQARKKALDELPRIPDRQRKAVHRAAKQLASRPVLTEEIVERDIAAELSALNVQPTAIHLEWALHYLRVLAHRQRLAEQAERDDEEALMLLI